MFGQMMLSPAEAGDCTLYLEASPGECRCALVRAGSLAEFLIDRPAAPDGLGDVFWARVTARVPAMAGYFVSLGAEEAFLPESEAQPGLGVGDGVVVAVSRAAQGGKGKRVSARQGAASGLAGGGKPGLLRLGPSAAEELRAAYPQALVVEGRLPEALEAEIEALGESELELGGGMRASIVPTPALTAIDLDAGGQSAARMAKAEAQAEANRAAIGPLVRQVILRNLSGAIVVDFAGMAARKRASLAAPLQAALAGDRLGARLLGFSALGFAELLRPRLRPPLHEKLAGPLAAGLAGLRLAAREAQAAPGQGFALRAAASVVAALQAEQAALAAYARGATYPLVLRADAGLAPCAWVVEPV